MTGKDFSEQFEGFKDKLFRFALFLTGHRESAEDIVQDAFLKVWGSVQKNTPIRNLEAFCMMVVKNLSIDHLNFSGRYTFESSEGLKVASPDLDPDLREKVSLVKSAIDKLPESQRDVIHLRDVQGYSYEEIADILGIELSNVKIRIHRARKKIKDEILQLYG